MTPLPTITAPPGGPGGAVLACLLALLGVPAGAAARVFLGRMRRGARVPSPWCEAGVAVAWAVTGAGVGSALVPLRWLPVLIGLGWFAVAAAAVDVRHHRLPDALTLPAMPLALALLVPLGSAAVLRGLAGAAVAVAAHAVLHLAAPAALGAGDVKLAAPLGSVLAAASWPALVLAALLAAVLSGGLAVVVLVRQELCCRVPDCRVPGRRLSGRRELRRRLSGRRVMGRQVPGRRVLGRRVSGRRVLGRQALGGALPHGPSMLAAGWLVTTAAAAGVGGGP